MKELLDKISSYNIFNYLLPGVLFAYIASILPDINLIQDDLIAGAFLYYLVGLIISRIGSLIIAPLLRYIGFIKVEKYSDFIDASAKDNKIELFSEVNNMYRTLLSMSLMLLIAIGYSKIVEKVHEVKEWSFILIVILFITLFLFAYRKQTNFITNRIKHHKK
jgi:hypothetical protein